MFPSNVCFQRLHPEINGVDFNVAERLLGYTGDFVTMHMQNELKELTYLGGYPVFVQGDDQPPGTVLLMEMEESEASTNMWGDCGTAQVWMTTGDDYGRFMMQFACG